MTSGLMKNKLRIYVSGSCDRDVAKGASKEIRMIAENMISLYGFEEVDVRITDSDNYKLYRKDS